jgi:hypothetical protein
MGPGTQPRGNQKTGRLRYHHTRTSCAPVVLIQMNVENLTPKDVLADVRVVSGVSYVPQRPGRLPQVNSRTRQGDILVTALPSSDSLT